MMSKLNWCVLLEIQKPGKNGQEKSTVTVGVEQLKMQFYLLTPICVSLFSMSLVFQLKFQEVWEVSKKTSECPGVRPASFWAEISS